MKKVFLILALFGLLCLPPFRACQAQTLQERLISSTFKTLAKTYIAASDLKKLKANSLAGMSGLDTDDFHAKYPRTLKLIGDSPVLAKRFGLRPDMSVEQARSFVRSLNKKKISMIIDAVPDDVVARHVMEDISQKTRAAGTDRVIEQIHAVWRSLQERLERTRQRNPS